MTDQQIVNFVEWVLELQRPAYDADTTRRFTELYTLNHYTNMQPLCSYTNRYIKRNKFI